MSTIKHIQLSYDQLEDRLVLSFSTEDALQVRFWITRKMLKVIWNILLRIEEIVSKEEEEEALERETAATKIQDGVLPNDFALQSSENNEAPFGYAPLLLSKITASPNAQGGANFRLEDNQGHSVEFSGNGITLSGLHQMIIKILIKTDWDLKFI